MDQLVKAVRPLIEEELTRANKEFPMFASDHEGLAVIAEEIVEARTEVSSLMVAYRELKKLVFGDGADADKEVTVNQMSTMALFGACELIQVAAMCKKFEESRK